MGKLFSINKNNSNLNDEFSIYNEIIKKYNHPNSKSTLITDRNSIGNNNINSNNYTQHGRHSLNLNLNINHPEEENKNLKRNKSLNKTYDNIKTDLKRKEKNSENKIFKFIFSSTFKKLKCMKHELQESLDSNNCNLIYKKKLSIKENEISKYFK
jgi:hypothetical protein